MSLSVFEVGQPEPCPSPFNLAEYVLGAGRDTDPALIVANNPDTAPKTWFYADLRDAVYRTAGGLAARGIRPGDRILLCVGNDPAFATLFLGAIIRGAIPVPTSTLLTESELRSIAAELSPALTCFAGGLAPIPLPGTTLDTDGVAALSATDPIPAVLGDPNRLAYMIYTSGTSGKPCAVMHAHRAVWARRMMWDRWYGLRPNDRVLHSGAFNWTYTLGTGLLDPWATGTTAMIYTGAADRRVWGKLAVQLRPSIFAATPGVFRQIVSAGAKGFESLRHALSAGEKLPAAVRTTWIKQTGKEVYEALGMSECSTFISHPASQPLDPATSGRVQPGRRIAVLGPDHAPVPEGSPGQLAIHRSDQGLMLGYFNKPAETAARFKDDWFLTGDTVVMAGDTVTYLGREDDMINAGGYRVSPLEVEAVLLTHPSVIEAAAVAHEVKPGVTVIAAHYVGQTTPEELMEFCNARMARYKQPRIFIARDTLPRGTNGKIRRKVLRSPS
ncbi:MAG: acyl--CoA ligase [Rhodobacteraceae bacterium]|nr:acyl--CoA ligase [Paracoccaceae bacterium]